MLVDDGALPIPVSTPMLAAGVALDDIGLACGGWTISWAGATGPITDGSTVIDGLRRRSAHSRCCTGPTPTSTASTAPYGVVSVHELPYVEGGGDRADLTVPTSSSTSCDACARRSTT